MTIGIKHLPLIILCLLSLSNCSTPLLPAPKEPAQSRTELSDNNLLASLRHEWQMLHRVQMSEPERQALMTRYNEHLLLLLRRTRHDLFIPRSSAARPLPHSFSVDHPGISDARGLRDVYDDIVPAADVRTRDLDEHYTVPGLGVPLVGVIPAAKIRAGDNLVHFRTCGTVSTLTALLEFPKGKPPILRLIPRHMEESVRLGRIIYPLAGDFSAPIEIYWNLTGIRKGRYLGLLHPQKLRHTTGLTCMERYNPHKIPVVLLHGLASSAETFHNLVNRLLSDPHIRHNYQFWYFNYPTGLSWAISAEEFRRSLREVRHHFDPQGSNKNWDKMVLVGHSMGGLITHLNQSYPAPDEKVAPPDTPKLYNFSPLRVGRVVYMATPHRGAPIARNRIVLFLSSLVELPQTLVQEVFNLATLQQDNIITHPGRLTERYTSLAQLSPDSQDIRRLAHRSLLDTPTHSIIGDRGRHNSPRSSDGIVPYWSSHLPWGTENIVPTDHSVQDSPETAQHLRRILREHSASLRHQG